MAKNENLVQHAINSSARQSAPATSLRSVLFKVATKIVDMAAPHLTKQSLRDHFGGDAIVEEVERLVSMRKHGGVQQGAPFSNSVEMLPQGAVFLLGGLVQHAGGQASKAEGLVQANVSAMVMALTAVGFDRWTPAAASARGKRLLEVPETKLRLLAAPGGNDLAALRFLAKVVGSNLSAAEVARVLQEDPEGRQWLVTSSTSPTFGAVVLFSSFWWDDVWDWLKGAAQWVSDAVNQFGEEASKLAKAVVDSVFSAYEWGTKIAEQIPFVGLVVAGIYAAAGKSDEAYAALAVNVNAIVTLIGIGVGSILGGPAGGMAGGALGKAAGLLIQKAISSCIEDPKMRAEVGDIDATRFIIDIALAGAAGGAAGIGEALAESVGWNIIKTIGISSTLATLLGRIPGYFAHEAM